MYLKTYYFASEMRYITGEKVMRDDLNEQEKKVIEQYSGFPEWIQYLIATAERPDLMGYSDHIVQVIKK